MAAVSSNVRIRVLPPPPREEEQCCQLPCSHWIPSLACSLQLFPMYRGSLAGHSHALLSHWQNEEEEDRQTYQVLQQHGLVRDLCCSPKPTVSKEKSVKSMDTAGSRHSSPVPGSTPSPQGWAVMEGDQRNRLEVTATHFLPSCAQPSVTLHRALLPNLVPQFPHV